MRLSPSQKHVLCLAHQAEGWMEIFPKEARTAMSLEGRGWLVLHHDRRSVALNDAGNNLASTRKGAWKPN